MSTFKQVRIMALSCKDLDFSTKEAVKEYFEEVVPNNGHTFYLKKQRFVCIDNTLIYFQYKSRIIARVVSGSIILDEYHRRYLPIHPDSIRTSELDILTSELGVHWWRGGDRTHCEQLNKSVRRGALYIDPEEYLIINSKCF